LLSLKNSSYKLTAAENGVVFDIDGNGILEQISWTDGESDEAFLVLDRNGNGLVDNGTELFGNYTPRADGSIAENGFQALADLDTAFARNGRIDTWDAAYTELRLWIDRNHNGISDPGELSGLAERGVVAIFTGYKATKKVDRYGSQFAFEGGAMGSVPHLF